MPAVATVSDFLQVARKSNQIDNARLDEFLGAHPSLPSEPRKLAQVLIRQGLITTFQAEQFLQGKYKGFRIGHYRVIERLGAGGAGTVYLAEHELMQRRVAVKVLPTELLEDPSIVARFRQEAQAAAVLDHPNVVHVYDLRQEGKLHYIVMEYVDGPNLQQILARKKALEVSVACEYIRQAALGLQHTHDAGMVHRDVKPANILVDSTATVKVLDLGLARVERVDEEGITRKYNNGAVLGTADFLAPEQALNLHEVDFRADIYGLGATLYTLLTGRPPFDGGSIAQKLMWHQTRAPKPIKSLRPEVPAELADLVGRMLAKKPADRPATMRKVAEALVPWASEALPQKRPSPRSLAAMRRAGPRTSKPGGSATDRLMPPSSADTWVENAQQDTARIEPEEPSPLERPLPDLTLGGESGRKVLLLGGVVATVVTLVVGVVALLLWGPKP
jgi:serine/threonine protein kinase